LKFDIFPSNFLQKVVSLVSSGENEILALLDPCINLLAHHWKIHHWLSGKNTSGKVPGKSTGKAPGKRPTTGKSIIGCLGKVLPAPIFRGTCSSIEILKEFMARECLGSPA